MALLAAAVLILACAGAGYALTHGKFSTPSHPVPYVVGLAEKGAQARLQTLKFDMSVSSNTYDPARPKERS